MATIPVPRSYNEIVGDMVDAFLSRFGIPNMKVGSPVLSMFESAAQSDFRNSQDIFSLLNAISLDQASGIAVDRIGADEDAPRITARPSSGKVTVTDISFVKISTKIFQGSAAPIVGSIVVNVVDASLFPASGNIYLGRNTLNYEGPLPYGSKVDNGTYWTLNLSSPTLRFHNVGESVIVAQGGNRIIGAGQVVQTPQGNVSDALKFTVLYTASIPDGETSVDDVFVVAQKPGIDIPFNAINAFATPPFAGATVTNPLPFSNSLQTESDQTYRERIRAIRQSRVKGTPLALKTFITGITAQDENKTITSASVVTRQGFPAVLYIDDGTGYEELDTGISIEPLTDLALGGEQYFELTNRPVAKAFITTAITSPFNLVAGSKLALLVGGVRYEHTFDASAFRNIESATAFEIVSSINGDPTLQFSARTTGSGSQVSVFAKDDINEDVQVVVPNDLNDANVGLEFPTGRVDTMLLYKNDRLLSKDGSIASIQGNPFGLWNTITGSPTMILSVDGTPALTYTFTNQDFIDGKTGFNTVGKNSVAAWLTVINNKIPGVTATESAGSIVLTSNLGRSGRAAVNLDIASTLVVSGMFSASDLTAQGTNSDYTLDRNNGQIKLQFALAVGDRLAAGTLATRAFLESKTLSTINLLSDANLWFNVDDGIVDASNVPIGVTASTPLDFLVSAVERWGYRFRIRATSLAPLFSNIKIGDNAIFWDSAIPTSLDGTWRIAATTSAYFEIERPSMVTARGGHASAATIIGGQPVVLAIGGFGGWNKTAVLRSAESYEISITKWSALSPMGTARALHTATTLNSNKVLVVGGIGPDGNALLTVELFDPGTGLFSFVASLPAGPRYRHTATKLSDGTVLVTGGTDGATYYNTAYIYDPVGNSWTATTNTLTTGRAGHTATLLATNDVLVTGGQTAVTVLNSVEKLTFAGTTWVVKAPMTTARQAHTASLITATGHVLAVGGSSTLDNLTPVNLASTENYNVGGDSWAAGPTLVNARSYHVMVELSGGSMLAGFGHHNLAPMTDRTEILSGGVWSAIPNAPLGTFDRVSATMVAGLANTALVMGGLDTDIALTPNATSELWTGTNNTGTWSQPDSADASALTLPNNGLIIVRTDGRLQQVTVPAGNNYTAASLAAALIVSGATSTVFKTNKIRLNTNSFNQLGDIGLLAADIEGQKIGIEVANSTHNLSGHLGSVEAGNSGLGTPNFQIYRIIGSDSPAQPLVVGTGTVTVDQQVVGLKNIYDSITISRFGSNKTFRSTINSVLDDGGGIQELMLTVPAPLPWVAEDRVYMASPVAIASDDVLTVLADGNTDTERFAVNMWRDLTPVGAYGNQNTFKDKDSSNVSLAVTFGLNPGFDFTDFAVYMPARAKTHSADASKRILWRYYRLGADGNTTKIRYSLPTAPNSALSIQSVDTVDGFTYININLSSGVLVTGYPLTNTAQIGVANSAPDVNGVSTLAVILGYAISNAVRAAGTTTLTLTLPPGVTDHGIPNLSSLYLKSNFPAFIVSQQIAVTAVSPTTIQFADAGIPGAQANLGTISFDTSESSLLGASPVIVTGDIAHISIPFAPDILVRISALGDQYLIGKTENPLWVGGSSVASWNPLTNTSLFQIYVNGLQTATAVAAAATTLFNAANSSVSVRPTVVGTGAGVISQATFEEENSAFFYYDLVDGINYVKLTTFPGSIAGDYQFTFKNNVDSSLTTNSDWPNETVRIVPITTDTLVRWFNVLTVSGISNVCSVLASSDATKLQFSTLTAGSAGSVQVQGGTANSTSAAVVGSSTVDDSGTYDIVTVRKVDMVGFTAGQWLAVNNTNTLPKEVFVPATHLLSIDASGNFTFDSFVVDPIWTAKETMTNGVVKIERQGRFIAVTDTGLGNAPVVATAPQEGDLVYMAIPAAPTGGRTSISVSNTGVFRVVRIVPALDSTAWTFWIENPNAVEDDDVELDLKFLTPDSLVAGDKISINSDIWGTNNKGTWIVETVGTAGGVSPLYTNRYSFKVSTVDRVPTAIVGTPALGANSALIQAIEGTPARFIKQIRSIKPNQTDGSFSNVKLQTKFGFASISAAAGSILNPLDKLAFDTTIHQGIDGYKYSTGLIGEANRVAYGVPSDPATYPGIVAAGAIVNISGSLVKRIFVAVLIRARSGAPKEAIEAQVKSAIAAVVNKSAVGQPIAFNDIVTAAGKVSGVVSVTIVSPTYGIGNDLISVQPFEKPLVLDLDQDVQVSFVGD